MGVRVSPEAPLSFPTQQTDKMNFKNSSPSSLSPKKNLLILLFVVFVEILGVGIIIPLHPFLAAKFAATDFQVGLLVGLYSLMQFISAPFWGKLSDRIGRRPIILVGLLGSVIGHLGFGFSTSLWVLFFARGVSGLFAGTLATAMAAAADLSSRSDRSKYMTFIGITIGFGFAIGPALGAFFAYLGKMIGTAPPFGESFAAIMAGVICLINWVFAFFILQETLSESDRLEKQKDTTKLSRYALMLKHLKRPVLGAIMATHFLYYLGRIFVELPLFFYVKDQYGWGASKASLGFAYMAFILLISQGFITRRSLHLFGEGLTTLLGLLVSALGYFTITTSYHLAALSIGVTILAVGAALVMPAMNSCLSLLAKSSEQGEVLGVSQSLSALARILSPVAGAWAYQNINDTFVFYFAGSLILAATTIVYSVRKGIPQEANRKPS